MILLHISLTGAAIILLAVIVRAVAVNALPKRTFLVLWWVVLARLLIPVSLPAFGADPVLGGIGRAADEAWELLSEAESAVTGAVRPSPDAPVEAETSQAETSSDEGHVLTLVWAAGAALAAGAYLISYLRFARELRASLPVEEACADAFLRDHRLRRRVSVRSIQGLSTPLTYGLFRPIILMPAEFDWRDKKTADYILYHEYVHIRRLDTLAKGLAALAVCVHWFNPLVWVFALLFDRDLELACDERVVRHFGADSRKSYALTLIDLEERRAKAAPLRSYFAKNTIEERICAIMKTKRTTVFAAVAAALIVALAVTAAAAFPSASTGMEAVLHGEASFIYASDGTNEARTISDVPGLFSPDDSYMRIWAYTLLDLDGDGEDEAVLSVYGASGDTGGQLILHRIDGRIYAYKTDSRTLTDLKADGTGSFSDPTGVRENGICAVSGFSKTGLILDKFTLAAGASDGPTAFTVDSAPATEERFNQALRLQSEKPAPEWFEFDGK